MTTQEHYEECLANGCSPRLAEMLALAAPPMSNTDREFLEGRCNGNQFEGQPWQGDAYQAIAQAAGVNTKGKVYRSGLAAFPGDPEAWVSGRGDLQRVCEARGWDCEGSVRVKAAPQEPVRIGLADDLVQAEVEQVLAQHPEPATVDRGELTHEIRELRKPHWAK